MTQNRLTQTIPNEAKNIFMASMYFFVPLNEPRKFIRRSTFHHIECQSPFLKVSSICSYIELNDKNQTFFFNSTVTHVSPESERQNAI